MMKKVEKNTFGIWDQAIHLTEAINDCEHKTARHAALKMATKYKRLALEINQVSLWSVQEYFLRLLRADFLNTLTKQTWPWLLKDRMQAFINTNSKILINEKKAMSGLKHHLKLKEKYGETPAAENGEE